MTQYPEMWAVSYGSEKGVEACFLPPLLPDPLSGLAAHAEWLGQSWGSTDAAAPKPAFPLP